MSKRVDKKNLKRFAENLKTNANILKRDTEYLIDQTINKGQVVLKCTTAGTTDTSALDLSSVSVGDILTDGTVEWEVVSITGYGFGNGSGETSISEWITNKSYSAGDVIIKSGSLFRCNTAHTSNVFNTDIDNWDLMYADLKDWEVNTYYTEGVTVIYDHKIYKCVTTHTSESSFSGAEWEQIGGDYITVPVKTGEIGYISWQYTLMDNHLALDGSVITNFSTRYSALYDFFNAHNLITTVQADYDSNKALCLYNSTTDEATLPDFLDKTLWGGNSVEEKNAGLPNIEGTAVVKIESSGGSPGGYGYDGAFTYFDTALISSLGITSPSYLGEYGIKLDASRSNPIYGNSDTVQPTAIQLIPQIRYKKEVLKGSLGDIYDDTPVGTVISFMGNSAPRNYLSCDGNVYNIEDYQALADFINDEFGSYNFFGGDGTTTFAVPDLRGEFLRGTGTNIHTNQGSGEDVGVHQDGTAINHIASFSRQIEIINYDTSYDNINKNVSYSGGANDAGVYYTTRPTNTSILYCIKYKNTNNPFNIQEWEPNTRYEEEDFVIKDNQIYKCRVVNNDSAFNLAHWQIIGGTLNSYMPIGTVIEYSGTVAPAEYLNCNGSVINIEDYSVLAEYITNTFGIVNYFGGDGIHTFAVPNYSNAKETILWEGALSSSGTVNIFESYKNFDELGFYNTVYANNNTNDCKEIFRRVKTSQIEDIIVSSIADDVVSTCWGYGNFSDFVDVHKTSTDTSLDLAINSTLVHKIVGIKYDYTDSNTIKCIKYTNEASGGGGDSEEGASINHWQTTTEYKIGDLVIYNNQIYECNIDHTSTSWEDDIANWDMISGLQIWARSTTYKKDSLVFSDGSLYRVIRSFTSTSVFDDTNLELIGGEGSSVSGGGKQVTKLGVIAPKEIDIEVPRTNKFNHPSVEVLKLTSGTQNVTTNALTFDVGDGSKFNVNDIVASESPLVVFDSVAKPNHGVKYPFGETVKMVDNYYAESEIINLDDFVSVEEVTLA